MEEEQLDDRIEKYNLGHLSEAEAERFEAEMLANPRLAEAVREHRAAWEIGELLAEERLRARIRARFADAPPSPDLRPGRIRKFMLAVLLLLLGAAVFFVVRNRQNAAPAEPSKNAPAPEILPEKTPGETTPPAPEQPKTAPSRAPEAPIAQTQKQPEMRRLALANYRIPDGLSGIRGADDSENLSRAAKAFFEKNYARTLDLLATLPENDRQEALALRAHAHFGSSHFAAAARDFSELENGGVYRREAQWFGILARLAADPAEEARALSDLETIIQNGKHPYRIHAEALKQAILQAKK